MADMRKCIGSAKFGIEAHEAPVDDFPAQPSQKDGLGPDVQAPLEPVHERAAEGGAGPQGRRGRGGRRGGADRAGARSRRPSRSGRGPSAGAKAVVPEAGSQGDAG